MSKNIRCAKCDAEMEVGFFPDLTFAGAVVGIWAEGAPEVGGFGGAKLDTRKRKVEAYRCTQCGFIELYARTVTY